MNRLHKHRLQNQLGLYKASTKNLEYFGNFICLELFGYEVYCIVYTIGNRVLSATLFVTIANSRADIVFMRWWGREVNVPNLGRTIHTDID